jgi:hypothetical protein
MERGRERKMNRERGEKRREGGREKGVLKKLREFTDSDLSLLLVMFPAICGSDIWGDLG